MRLQVDDDGLFERSPSMSPDDGDTRVKGEDELEQQQIERSAAANKQLIGTIPSEDCTHLLLILPLA